MADIHVGDIGTALVVTVTDQDGGVVDLSVASSVEIWLQTPDETKLTKTATLTTDGTDGKAQYETQDGDISVDGTWQIQPVVYYPDGDVYHGSVTKFKVRANVGA